MNNVVDKIKTILKNELNVDHIDDKASQDNTPEWDSISYMAIVSQLEREFNIEVTPDNIQKFSSVSSILEQITK